MNLDDLHFIHQLDPQNMLTEIDSLPAQLEKAWELGLIQPFEGLKTSYRTSAVIIAGMGGSAIGADLLAAYITPVCRIPIIVWRDYGLPAWAQGPEILVITSSHSGNTEETLETFEAAIRNQCRILAFTTGGILAERAGKLNIQVWKFDHKGQPRAAVGFSFGLLLAFFSQMGLIDSPEIIRTEVSGTVESMKKQQETIRAEIPVMLNPAKRLAGQLVGRWVNIYGSGCLAPVARRWKGQINEIAKAGAGFEALPEADHNALAGLVNPADIMSRTMTLFLSAPSDHPRNRLRTDLTRHGFMIEGLNTEIYKANGENRMAHIWTSLHFGDYLAYYLAMAYGINPTPVEALENFKTAMQTAREGD
jgi:glucose/mannose-6-phosphate isomerase